MRTPRSNSFLFWTAFLTFGVVLSGAFAESFPRVSAQEEAASASDSSSVPNEIERMKAKYGLENSVADLAPTVCAVAGLRAPKTATANAIPAVLDVAKTTFDGRSAQKIFLYCGDCVGDVLLQNCPDDFRDVLTATDVVVKSANVMKTVTPVNFATIFTGAGPEVHGIRVYEKPVVRAETLFDVFLEAGKKIAIISAPGNSVITIFRERNLDYVETKSDADAFETARKFLENGSDYDLIVVHDCEYDSEMHANGTESPKAAAARRVVLQRWLDSVAAVDSAWANFDRLTVFVADHGSHTPENTKNGVHGEDVRDDAVVNHFYRLRAASK